MKLSSQIKACTSESFVRSLDEQTPKQPIYVTHKGAGSFVAVPAAEWDKIVEQLNVVQTISQQS